MNSAAERNKGITLPHPSPQGRGDITSPLVGEGRVRGVAKPNLNFQELEEKHLPEVLEIERASFSDPWSEEMFRIEIGSPSSISRAAYDVAGLAGYCILRVIQDEGHIMNLAVHPQKRKKGYGAAMLEYILKAGEEMFLSKFVLEVGADNISAVKLYIKNGFTNNRLRKKYYATGEDAYEMILNV